MNSPTNHIAKSSQTADTVQQFYNRHPYPPPVKDLDGYRQRWQDLKRRRADYHLHWPAKPYRADQTILIAGCGTSQAAKHALRQPAARVIGIDVSSTSIQHTEVLKRQYNLTNLEIHQLPIERVHELGQEFDRIICTGVLHHLSDPDAGLLALREVLKPQGAMRLMVYATYGRAGIYMLQEYCHRLEIGQSDQEIRDLANTLMALPPDHPLAHLLGNSPDFRSKAGLADALLHPQDRAYTVPQLFDFIRGSGLRFGRWVRQAPYLPYCGDFANTPHVARLTQLSAPEQYAAIELFRGTMLRHSAIVYRDDNPLAAQPIQFADEQWRDYIPHRLPQTICVEEKLPLGAAAVLINQSHTCPDIYLPINQQEKRLLGGIDGQRNIAEITRHTAIKQTDYVQAFFEKLWWYDQVVFEVPS